MKKMTRKFAAVLLTSGVALGTYAGASTPAGAVGDTANASSTQTATTIAAQDVGAKASCAGPSENNWLIPDGEDSWAGRLFWEDTNEDTGADQDNFYLDDRNLDGQSSSVLLKNNYTGKKYYKHAYNGDAYCIGIGNVPKGKTVSWKACGWDNGKVVECEYGKVTE